MAGLIFRASAILFVLLLSLLACTSREGTSPPKTGAALQGTVRISGAWALYPMMVRWAEEYRKDNPSVKIDISAGGAGKGIADTLSGLTDMGMVSREIKPEEIKLGALHIAVVKDAVFPVMNAANPQAQKITREKGLTKKAFIDLWINGKALTWGEAVAGGSGDPIQVYTRSDSCGAAETWAKYLGDKSQEDLKGIAVYGDPGLADAVRKDVRGIGYNNLNYAFDMKTGLPVSGLLIVPIDVNENGRLDAQELLDTKEKAMKAVLSGAYPSPPARDLYLVGKGSFTGPSRDFLEWILTEGQKFVEEAGYIRLSAEHLKEGMKKIGK
jgi:phosphate transport system substrate-binding protein